MMNEAQGNKGIENSELNLKQDFCEIVHFFINLLLVHFKTIIVFFKSNILLLETLQQVKVSFFFKILWS